MRSRGRSTRGRSSRVVSGWVNHAREFANRPGSSRRPVRTRLGGRESCETRRSGRRSRAATRGGAVRRRVRVVESNARVNASSDRSSENPKAVSERWKLLVCGESSKKEYRKEFRVERNFRRRFESDTRSNIAGIARSAPVRLPIKRLFSGFARLPARASGSRNARLRLLSGVFARRFRGEARRTTPQARAPVKLRSRSSNSAPEAREVRLLSTRAHVPERQPKPGGSRRRVRRGRRRVRAPRESARDPRGGPPGDGAASGGGGEDVDGGAHTRALPHGRQRLRRSARRLSRKSRAGGEPDGARGRVHLGRDAAGKDDDDELGDDFRRSKTNDDRDDDSRESVS